MPKRTIAGDLPAPMLAKVQPDMPVGDGWTYEPKWDGFRTIVAIDTDGTARLASRDGRPLGRYFPELLELLERDASHGPFVADAEIVRVAPGRMDFDELQLRLHPAESRVRKLAGEIPATLIVFDLLWLGDEGLAEVPLAERRERLATLASAMGWEAAPGSLDDVPTGPTVLAAPWTDDPEVARGWFADDAGIGQDGIIAKRAEQPYLSGERGWIKVKHRSTLDCVVGGYRLSKTGDGIGALLLGLYDGRRHAALRRAHVLVQGEGATGHPRAVAAARGRRQLRGWSRAGRAEPVERRQGHRMDHPAAGAGVRGHDRPGAVRAVPPRRELRPLARRPRARELHLRPDPGGRAARVARTDRRRLGRTRLLLFGSLAGSLVTSPAASLATALASLAPIATQALTFHLLPFGDLLRA